MKSDMNRVHCLGRKCKFGTNKLQSMATFVVNRKEVYKQMYFQILALQACKFAKILTWLLHSACKCYKLLKSYSYLKAVTDISNFDAH